MENFGAMIAVTLFIAVFGGIIWLALYFGKKQANKTWDHYVRLGQMLGINVVKPTIGYFMPPMARLEGPFRGLYLSIHTEKRRSGKHTYIYTVLNLRLSANPGFEFRLIKEGFFQKIGKAFGMQDIQTGNEAFDKAFVLKSADQHRALQVFDMMLCNKLVEHEGTIRSTISLANGTIHYEEMMMVNSESNLNRVAFLTQICTEIAEKITGGGQRVRY